MWEWEQEKRERMGNRNRNGRSGSISNELDIDPAADDVATKAFRDSIAEKMWIDYQAYVHR